MSEQLEIRIEPSIEGQVSLGWFRAEGVDPSATSPAFESDLGSLCARLRRKYAAPAEAASRNRPARSLYRAVGIDPTKHRPSSEALLRRVLTGRPLYRVNAVVDAANYCSLEAALPVGLYDLEHIRGTVSAGLGRAGDGYQGIGKDRVNLEGKIVLRDEQGSFGNPSADSFRTRIREETGNILFLLFAPAGLPRPELEQLISFAGGRMSEYAGGTCTGWGILPLRD